MSRAYIPKALRDRVSADGRGRWGYCLTQESIVGCAMEIDHIHPESQGGATTADNLWLACSQCNTLKSDQIVALDLETGELVSLFHPRTQKWFDHFAWSSEGDRILGLTPTGRATVVALSLNRPPLVSSRLRWASVGWHPPKD